MVRGFGIVERIIEPIETDEAKSGIDEPDTIDATVAEDNIDFGADTKNGVTLQNLGPDPVKLRINGTAGTADADFHLQLPKNTAADISGVAVSKVSAITDSGTAKVKVTSTESVV